MDNQDYKSCKSCQCEITKRISERYSGYCKNCYKQRNDLKSGNKKVKRIILSIIVLVIIGIILKNPIILEIEKNSLKNQIATEIINDFQYKSYKLDGKYTNQLTITMKDDFENFEYAEKTRIIETVSKKFRTLYNEHKEKLVDKSNKDYAYDEIKGITKPIAVLISKNNKYQIQDTLKKNEKEYSENDYLKEKILSQLNSSTLENKEELTNTLNSTKYDKEILSNIYAIQDMKEKANELIYQTAKLYSNEDYKKGLELYQKILDYKDTKDLIEQLNKSHEVDGEWYGKQGIINHRWIINGNKCYNVYSNYSYKYTYDEYYCIYENNILYAFKNKESANNLDIASYKMEYKNGVLLYEFHSYSGTYTITLNKESNNTKPKEVVKIKKPEIGMTKSEVENSTWGKPEDINKTTTAYGTREQWCYSGYKYIYFENGIVTSIQD